jgi:hypothetical protein
MGIVTLAVGSYKEVELLHQELPQRSLLFTVLGNKRL